MSEMQEVETFDPQWDVADRLQKALRIAGISAADMARFLDVHRNTMNNWLHGRTAPKQGIGIFGGIILAAVVALVIMVSMGMFLPL